MANSRFTNEQKFILSQNPYVYRVTDTRVSLTKEFKELFYQEYKSGQYPDIIMKRYGFDINTLGRNRIRSIVHHIRYEYEAYGDVSEGYVIRNPYGSNNGQSDEFDELKKTPT